MSLPEGSRILVTGGSGFLGHGIVSALLTTPSPCRVSVLDTRRPSEDVLSRLEHYFEADIADEARVQAAFVHYAPDLVIHTAGIIPARKLRYSKRQEDWERVKAINYHGTRHVLDATIASGCRRFVYTSSCTVVIDDLDHDYHNVDETAPLGNATLHYGKSKTMAEQYVLDPPHATEKGLLACALRPCTIIGPGDPAVIAIIHDLIAKKETNFIIGDGNNLSDWMYIDNAVHAHILAATNLLTSQTAAGHAFFISNQEPAYFWDFLSAIWAEFGHVPSKRWYIPVNLAWVAGWMAEWMTWATGGVSTLDTGSIKDGIRTQYLNNDKAKRILGYVPTVGLAEGVRLACLDYKEELAARSTARPLDAKTKT
ncbi:hypothetical protein LTR62_003781 [Meristemomyces frigidus]|uniref:3-beta hydroxysteroid dehydrogenase/isomerase domain-containing protein n=1 Tax=Meristemomyces frigidus TaxID=1508187 RepID=A0AAN7TH33_9PEZI|nr:hypothetical protein LTR62_003781 [Meristemomyces frigidus]